MVSRYALKSNLKKWCTWRIHRTREQNSDMYSSYIMKHEGHYICPPYMFELSIIKNSKGWQQQ